MITEKNINVINFVQMFQLTDIEMWNEELVFRKRRKIRASNTFYQTYKIAEMRNRHWPCYKRA